MRWAVTLGRIGPTRIKVHITFLIFLAWIAGSHYLRGGLPAALSGTAFLLTLFLCVLLHEFGHVFAARRYGIITPDITLLPIGGVARLQRMPDKPLQELVVALAGPLVNVVIAAGLALYIGRYPGALDLSALNDPAMAFAAKLLSVNVMLVLFNLIPAFPMDGGRALRALLALVLPYGRATLFAARLGQAIAFGFAFLGLFSNPLLIFIALFIYMGAAQESAMAQLRDVVSDMSVADAMVTEFQTLPQTATLRDAVDALLTTSQHEFPLVDLQGHPVAMLTRDDLISALKKDGFDAPAFPAASRNLPTLAVTTPFTEAIQVMNNCSCPALSVVSPSGELLGLLTSENIGEMMMVRSVLDEAPISWRRKR